MADKRFSSMVRIAPLGVGLLVFILLLPHLPPSLTFVDSGQLSTAAAGFGIPHPSGYPLFSLVSRLFIGLGDVWTATVGAAIASAAMLALAAALFSLVGIRLARQTGLSPAWQIASGITTSIAALISHIVLAQGLVVEVYALNLAAFAALLAIATSDQLNVRTAILFSFIAGLGLANHSSLVLPLLPLAIYVMQKEKQRLPFALLLAAFLLGFSLWLYLPLRSSVSPIVNWGLPNRLDRFWEHFSRSQYGGLQLQRLQFIFMHLWQVVEELPRQLGWHLLPFSALGFWMLRVANKKYRWLFAMLLLVTGPLAVFLLTLMLQPHQTHEMLIWLAPFFALAGFLCGWGIIGLLRIILMKWQLPFRTKLGLGVVALAAISTPLVMHLNEESNANYGYAGAFGRDMLSTMRFRANFVLESRGSLGAFELLYMKQVEGLRPDCRVVDTTATIFIDRANYETYCQLGPFDRGRWQLALAQQALMSGAPCYYSYRSPVPEQMGLRLVLDGMLFRVQTPYHESPDPLAPFAYYRAQDFSSIPKDDNWALQAAVQYLSHQGFALLMAGEDEQAEQVLLHALQLAQGNAWALASLGEGYIEVERWEQVAAIYELAVKAFPPEILRSAEFSQEVGGMYMNLAIARLNIGDRNGAEAAFRQVQHYFPDLLR